MKTSRLAHAAVLLFGVFVAAAAQVLLKKSASVPYKNKWKEYLNWRVAAGYGMMLASTLFSVYAYRVIPISLGGVLDASGYIFVTVFGVVFFHERVTKQRFIALVLIISGVLVYAVWG